MYDENYYKDLQLENEAEQRAIALQEPGNALQAHLQSVLKDRHTKEGKDWYKNRSVLQFGVTTGEEVW